MYHIIFKPARSRAHFNKAVAFSSEGGHDGADVGIGMSGEVAPSLSEVAPAQTGDQRNHQVVEASDDLSTCGQSELSANRPLAISRPVSSRSAPRHAFTCCLKFVNFVVSAISGA